MIETHAHLYAEEFDQDLDLVVERAKVAGVARIYMPNVDVASINPMLQIERKYTGFCIPMIGLHPCYVKENYKEELDTMAALLEQRPFAAIGEIGTDLYWDKTFFAKQQDAFRIQMEWACVYDYAMIIHCRESVQETIDLIKSASRRPAKAIFHCFSGTLEQAKEIIEMGYYLGIGGVVTFKNGGMDKVLPFIGIEHLVLETDSPYLAPVPHRGKRNEPAYLNLVVDKIAAFTGQSVDQIIRRSSENAAQVFREFDLHQH